MELSVNPTQRKRLTEVHTDTRRMMRSEVKLSRCHRVSLTTEVLKLHFSISCYELNIKARGAISLLFN